MSLFAKINGLICLGLISSVVAAAPPVQKPEEIRAQFQLKKAKIIQGIKTGIALQDLHKQGAFNPFKLAVKEGLVDAQENIPYWEGSGGGQSGTFIHFSDGEMNLSRNNVIAKRISNLYCDPAARILVEKGGWMTSAKYKNDDSQMDLCVEIGVDTSLDAFSLYNDGLTSGDRARAKTLPDVNATLSIGADAKVQVKFNYGGSYYEKVYIWPAAESRYDRREAFDKANVMPSDEKGRETFAQAEEDFVLGQPVAMTLPTVLPLTHFAAEMKQIPWDDYNNMPTDIDLKKADGALKLLSVERRSDGELLLEILGKIQKIDGDRRAAAERDGLYGTEDFQASVKACTVKGAAKTPECESIRKTNNEIAKLRGNNITQKNFYSAMREQRTRTNAIMNRNMSAFETDPSFFAFILEITKKS